MIAAAFTQKVFGGGGKSELRRAVCRITSGTDGLSHLDGKCNRERTALGWWLISVSPQAAWGKGEKVR
jgi:hypothetical protein